MNKETLKRYAELESNKKAIEVEQLQIKENILTELKGAGANKIESDEFGAFRIVERKSYQYTNLVTDAEIAVKELKKKEEESGTAKVEIKESLTFYPIKIK